MSYIAVPEFFERFAMRRVTSASLDSVLSEEDAALLSILFLWGRDCPNCDVAKRAMLLVRDCIQWPQVRWLHDNVYDDPNMATRFGLHGIPAFLFFAASGKWAVLLSGLVRKPLLRLLKIRLCWPSRRSQPVAWLNA